MSTPQKYYECFTSITATVTFNRVFLADNEEDAELQFLAWMDTSEGQRFGLVRDEEMSAVLIDEVGPMEFQVQVSED